MIDSTVPATRNPFVIPGNPEGRAPVELRAKALTAFRDGARDYAADLRTLADRVEAASA